jgi:hypothetical protein
MRGIHYHPGRGSDAVHADPEYCLAVTQLSSTERGLCGTGFALTLGDPKGTTIEVSKAIR